MPTYIHIYIYWVIPGSGRINTQSPSKDQHQTPSKKKKNSLSHPSTKTIGSLSH